jgi:hypothetical protein
MKQGNLTSDDAVNGQVGRLKTSYQRTTGKLTDICINISAQVNHAFMYKHICLFTQLLNVRACVRDRSLNAV